MSDQIEKLRAELKRLEKEEQVENEVKEKLKITEFYALPNEWKVEVKEEYHSSNFINGVRVTVRKEQKAYDEFMKKWGEAPSHKWEGMFYYRTEEGILTNAGGGSCILMVPKLCNDAEWKLICDGVIPDKFKSKWKRN